jgi:hypothetical protein
MSVYSIGEVRKGMGHVTTGLLSWDGYLASCHAASMSCGLLRGTVGSAKLHEMGVASPKLGTGNSRRSKST